MIAKLTGRLAAKAVDHVVLDVHDVGYRVFIPLSTYYDLPDSDVPVSFLIHTYVRDDALQLYGFLTAEECEIFEALLRVTKIGPKLALAMLSGMNAVDLQRAVVEGDVQRLSAIPGVGRKTAERIILELREKFAKVKAEPTLPLLSRNQAQQTVTEGVMALQNLGYPRPVAERTISHVLTHSGTDAVPVLKDLIRAALRHLGQEKGV
jgi:Holliday junction DNA helicase RuvA